MLTPKTWRKKLRSKRSAGQKYAAHDSVHALKLVGKNAVTGWFVPSL